MMISLGRHCSVCIDVDLDRLTSFHLASSSIQCTCPFAGRVLCGPAGLVDDIARVVRNADVAFAATRPSLPPFPSRYVIPSIILGVAAGAAVGALARALWSK